MDVLTDDDEVQVSVLMHTPVLFKMIGDAATTMGLVDGYGATWEPDRPVGGDRILPGAFNDTIADHNSAGTAPAFLWSHQPSRPIGKWTAMGEDARGLRVRGQLNLATE